MSTVLACKVIFVILVFDIIISLIYLNIYLKTFSYPLMKMAPIKRLLISALYTFYYLSIIHLYSMRVNDHKSCRKKHL